MTKFLLGGAAAAAIVAAGAAFAQPAAAPTPTAAPQVHVMHHGAAKTVTRDEVVAHVRDMFAKLDANRDGFVTREEADSAHQRLAGERREKRAKRVAERGGAAFDRLDTNKDGSISRQEFDAHRQQRQERRIVLRQGGEAVGGHPGMMRMHRIGMAFGRGHLFEMADTNKDGRVSLQEATATAVQHFDAGDLNRDGKLTPDERMQHRQQLRAQRRPA